VKSEKVEPIIWVLVGLIALFTTAIVYAEHMFKSDGQIFQVFSGGLTTCLGALAMRIKPGKSGDDNSVTTGNTIVAETAPVAQKETI
jgi:hypothetical protein